MSRLLDTATRPPRRARSFAAWSTTLLLAASLAAVGGPAPAASAPPSAAPPAQASVPERHTETLRVGPMDLAPQGQPGDQRDTWHEIPRPEGDLAIRSISFRLVDAHGEVVMPQDAHLHHMVMMDDARPDELCGYPPASRFAGTGMELTDIDIPEPYAYHSPVGSRWAGLYHVMNQSPEPITVSIEYTVTYTDAVEGGFLDVEPFFFDVDGCWGDSEFNVPGDGGPGSAFERSRTYTMAEDGTVVWAGGHLHVGGIDATLTGPGGAEVCRSEAQYGAGPGHGGHPMLTAITPCPDLDLPVSTGDQLTLTARYENDAPISGAMGIMTAYIHKAVDPVIAEALRAAYPPLVGRAPTTPEIQTWESFLATQGTLLDLTTFLAASPEGRQNLVAYSYGPFLGRVGDAPGIAYWTDRLVRGLPVLRFGGAVLGSPEAYQRAGGTDRAWVSALYENPLLLGRTPDASGLDYWATYLQTHGRQQVARHFLSTPEAARRAAIRTWEELQGGPAPSPVVEDLVRQYPGVSYDLWQLRAQLLEGLLIES